MTTQQFEREARVVERWDRCFRVMSAEPRRQVIASLLDTPPTESVSLPESAINPNIPVENERLEVALHHNHLPMLSEMGYVEWGTEPFEAERGPRFDEVAVLFKSLYS